MPRKDNATGGILGPAAKVLGSDVVGKWIGGHAGLIFDRYLPLWALDGDSLEVDIPRGAVFKTLSEFAQAYSQRGGDERLLQARLRQYEALARQKGGLQTTVRLDAPLAQGMGLDHPTGNGFLFDPVLGVPWIPGTALKGLCRQGARLMDEDRRPEPDEIRRVLGPEPESEESDVGTVVFLDAYPSQRPPLEVQVLTPHYISYYTHLMGQRPDRCTSPGFYDSPHGLDAPVPVHYLTVARGASYSITLLPTRGARQSDCAHAKDWLLHALILLGAGARTAVGHGFFILPESTS